MPMSMQLEPRLNSSFALPEESLEEMALVFKAMSDPARLKILAFLSSPQAGCCANTDGVCACDLESITNLSQPTVSHHMKLLAATHLVKAEKRGKWMYYSLEPQGFDVVKQFVSSCC
jgi:ArsR family transcriptional regulator, arsenate/arsenite/antimonite-responsive transcriptional repressor